MSSRLMVCVVCGTGVMHKSTDGVTCGDQRCKDDLSDKINDLLASDAKIDRLKEDLLKARTELSETKSQLSIKSSLLSVASKKLVNVKNAVDE